MNTAIEHGTLVTGNGLTQIEDSLVLVEGSQIEYAGERRRFDPSLYNTIDASGMVVMPGIVNTHAHGIVLAAPMFSSGSTPLSVHSVKKNREKHLSEGTTSILSVDGFAGPVDLELSNKKSVMRIMGAFTYSKKSYDAAMAVDGEGINTKDNLQSTVLKEDPLFVAAIGECGSGATLGGGVQDYKFIPEMLQREYGFSAHEDTARQIKEAVLGRGIHANAYDEKGLAEIISHIGIDASPEELRESITECVMPSVGEALEAIAAEAKLARRYRLPVVVHSALPSMDMLEAISKRADCLVIAGHSNHPSYTIDEALDFARTLKKNGAVIDISTFDTLCTGNRVELDNFMRFLEAGIVDTVTTDYGGGNHCSILSMLALAVDENVISLPQAVKLATSNPAEFVPLLGMNRGFLEEGHEADIAICDKKDISYVRQVFIGGNKVYAK